MAGPFYFAWVDEGTGYSAALKREDEVVLGFAIDHSEGDFPQATVDVKNPRIGLLNAGRKQWAWLSDDTGALFYGRLNAIPSELQAEVVTLTLIGRPRDWLLQRASLAAYLRTFPAFWDPVWIAADRRTDPDAVLEAQPLLWHVNRLTHVVTYSNIITGEAGTLALDGAVILDGSLSVTFGAPPARVCRVEAEVYWDQIAVGEIDLSGPVKTAFAAAGSDSGLATSYTGEGLERDWPKPEASIGSGWTVAASSVQRIAGTSVVAAGATTPLDGGARLLFPLWGFVPTFTVKYDTRRARTEKLSFTLRAGVQKVMTDPGDEDRILVTLSSSDVDKVIDDTPSGYLMPIRDLRRATFFGTDRGKQSLRYLLMLARARLLARARCVVVSCEVPFDTGRGLSCSHNVEITDPRLPGGVVVGKVTNYSLVVAGGRATCAVTIACTVGTGDPITFSAGSNSYADDYAEDGWQATADLDVVIEEAVAFTDFEVLPQDDGVSLLPGAMTPANLVTALAVTNGQSVQREVLERSYPSASAAADALNLVHTTVHLELVPLNTGPFETILPIAVTDLYVPKTIDLAAESTP